MKWTLKIQRSMALLGVLAFNFADSSPTNAANCDPSPSGLVSWWQAEGNATDTIGGSNGVIETGTTFTTGMVGQCFNFDGVNGCIMNTNTPPLTNIQNSFTMEFWAYPQKGFNLLAEGTGLANSGQSYAVFPDFGGSTGQAGVGVCVGTNGISVVEHAANYLNSELSYTNFINGWVHVAVVYSNKQPTLYVNGVKVRTGITSTRTFVYPSKNFGSSYASFGGTQYKTYGPYKGLLDEVSIYNRVLATNEITAIYNAGSGGKCPLPPTITSQPVSQTNMVGTTATFSVAATGTAPLNYLWFFGANPLGQQTNSTLVLSNVQPGQAGAYSVLVSNGGGSTNSFAATLTVYALPPLITTQPANRTNFVGTTAIFSVTASGTSPLNYQWSFNTTNILYATNAVLMLTNVQFAQAGNYAVLVTNAYGATNSATAVLAVNLPPLCDPPPAGLVNWWPGEGNATDVIGGSNGVVETGATFTAGLVGQCFSFDGVSGYVINGNTPPLKNIQNSFTMEFWAYPKKSFVMVPNDGTLADSGQSYAIFPSYGGYNAEAGVGMSVGTNGISVVEHAPYYLSSMLNYTNILTGWVHIAVVYSNKQPTLYVNGINVATGITSTRTFVYPSKDFGGSAVSPWDTYGSYAGLLDEISIYNRALTPTEIAAIYNASAGGKCPVIPPPRTAIGSVAATNGFVIGVNLIDGGYGYTNTPQVRFIGGGGSGAAGFAVVSNGVVISVTITNAGFGYTNAPAVVIGPPYIFKPVLAIAPMSFLSFSNLTVGGVYQLQKCFAWYWTNQPVSFMATNALYMQMVAGVVGSGDYRLALNPVPAQAFATPQVVNGFVVGATVTSGGSGYVAIPTVSIVGGGGTNAMAVAQISGGVVTSISITSAGTGYTNNTPTVRIAQPPAAAVFPTVSPVMRVDSASLAPYDNYQLQFQQLGGTWGNWNGLFSPTDVTNSQYIFITNGTGFFRLQHSP